MRSRLRTKGTAFLMLMVEEEKERNQNKDSTRGRGRQGRPRKRLGSNVAAIGGNTIVSGGRGDQRRKSRWPWRSELTGGGLEDDAETLKHFHLPKFGEENWKSRIAKCMLQLVGVH
ncbi:hypothetical protein E3N88_09845 [Mikania micrantha]|uniref:Uncharacterized protein n=1 Tax=Mikania micrantha TaxID=192012 RepID=A0A5N6PK73_9ASTR|nr:hypothetical protein E3N88_09845 [Mikania micrantha]